MPKLPRSQKFYDYIIVGAGSAGCVLANQLSADTKKSVLLLESGPPDGGIYMEMPRGVGKLFTAAKQQLSFYQASPGGNRDPEYWIKGRTLGGSSSVNGMVYTRGMPADYDGWVTRGCPGWGWTDIGACFEALENHVLGAAPWRGVGGPLHITIDEVRSPISEALIKAAVGIGAPRLADINDVASQSTGGFGYQPATIARGQRFSAASAFLAPVRKRSNLTVLTDAHTLQIIFEGRRASGVRVRAAGEIQSFFGREVILSAGAIESPKLLQLSGVGAGNQLKSLGIDIVVDAPEVGQNLMEHRHFAQQYQVASGSTNAAHTGVGLLRSLATYFLLRRGPLARSTFDLGGFVRTEPELDRPDGQIGLGLYTLKRDTDKTEVTEWPGITIGGYYLRPESRGEIRIVSKEPDTPPRIDANYFAVESDRKHTVGLFRWMRRLAAQPILTRFRLQEIIPGSAYETDDEIIDAVLRFGNTGYHVAGTCRMGSDEKAVLDPQLRVRGVDGLRVVDTSIMPSMVSGNTNGPAMAIALRATALITKE